MPKILELARPARALDGMLIKHAQLQNSLRAARLMADARRRAARILSQAEQQGTEYRRQGYLQGYGAGMMAGAEALVAALGDSWRLFAARRDSLHAELKAVLTEVLPQPALVMSLVDDWLTRHRHDVECEVEVLVPRAWHQALALLERRFAALPGARLTVHDAPHFVIRNGNAVYEFSPDAAAGQLQRQVLLRIRQEDLPEAHAEIARAALATLWKRVAPAGDAAVSRQEAL